MTEETTPQYYTGTVVEIIDKVLYEIKVDIPGFNKGFRAFPMRGELDEPRVGDFVLMKCLDPLFMSYFLYQKIKENDFIGFRSNGKMIDVTPDYIQISTFDPELEYNDLASCEDYRPDVSDWDWVRLDKDGNLNVRLRGNAEISIEGDSGEKLTIKNNLEITVGGQADITVRGNVNLTSETGTVKIDAPITNIVGAKPTAAIPSTSGNLNCIPNCPLLGIPHGINRNLKI